MKTVVLKINPRNPEKEKIKIAAEILRRGGLIAFPTDTVYGLGADATNSGAIKKIYKVKKRPLKNPLPILIAKKSDLKKYALRVPAAAKKLMDKFWPGPLTIVLKKKKLIPGFFGKNSVGLRIPDNRVTLALIRALGRPLAATSANISGKSSPTTAAAVKKYLNNKIDIILDGGKTKLGRDSTVLDCTISPPVVRRHGAISPKALKKYWENN